MKERRTLNQDLIEEIGKQVQSAVKSVPEILHEFKQDIKDNTALTQKVLEQALKTNGRVNGLEGREVVNIDAIKSNSEAIKTLLETRTTLTAQIKLLLWISGGAITVFGLLGFFYIEYTKQQIANSVISQLEDQYYIKVTQ